MEENQRELDVDIPGLLPVIMVKVLLNGFHYLSPFLVKDFLPDDPLFVFDVVLKLESYAFSLRFLELGLALIFLEKGY